MHRTILTLSSFAPRTGAVAWLPALLVPIAIACRDGTDSSRAPIALVETILDPLATPGLLTRSSPAVKSGRIVPAVAGASDFAGRLALVTPPGTSCSFRCTPERDWLLTYAVALDASTLAAGAPGLGFEVRVEGERVGGPFAPARPVLQADAWQAGELALAPWAGREIVVELAAEEHPRGTAVRGGWSDVRIVRSVTIPRRRASRERPSLLVVLVDSLRTDALGCYGGEANATPELDRLAAEGLVFENAVAPAPWTLPSVASLFTGLDPDAHGVVHDERAVLVDGLRTLAERLAAEGVTTGAFVTNRLVARARNFHQGFETFVELFFDPDVETLHTSATRWLREQHGLQTFAYVHAMEPHDPYDPPAELREAHVPPYGGPHPLATKEAVSALRARLAQGSDPDTLSARDAVHFRALYDAEVAGWDAGLGRWLRELEAEGLLEDVVVVVTSDHGEEFLDHGMLTHGHSLHEELVRVPLIVWAPGRVAPGRVATPVRWTSLHAALIEIARGRIGTPSALAAMSSEVHPILLATEYGQRPGAPAPQRVVGLRRGNQKLMWFTGEDRYELYDLDTDPLERVNLLADRSAEDLDTEVPALALLLHGHVDAAVGVSPWNEAAPDDAMRSDLSALGYVR